MSTVYNAIGVSRHNQILDTDLVLSSLTKIPMRMRIVALILSFVFAAAAAGAEGNLSHPPLFLFATNTATVSVAGLLARGGKGGKEG